jgi:hypothetical protein
MSNLIFCPYCNTKVEYLYPLEDEETSDDIECDICHGWFTVTKFVETTYEIIKIQHPIGKEEYKDIIGQQFLFDCSENRLNI